MFSHAVDIIRFYLNRPDLTKEKFIDNPFGEGKIYKTGDLVRWTPEGNIDFLGRIDNQVKIRGNRIELGEIETKIQSSGFVENAAVLVKGKEHNRKFLVGYVIPKKEYSEDKLFDYLSNHLRVSVQQSLSNS